jgi:predicted glycoside hydrolase/deacetylase ChbG (UPF0249 family)
MMNQPYVLSELPKLEAECPGLGLGVHLTLTLGSPILPVNQVPSLVNEQGHFFRRENFIRHLPQLNMAEVLSEWQAQVEKFVKATGRQPDHLDAHHHSAYYTPALFETLLKYAAELNCPIRVPYGQSTQNAAEYLPGGNLDADFTRVNVLQTRYAPRTTQGFCGTFYNETATQPYLRHALKQISVSSEPTWELMVHPALVDEPLLAISSYSTARADEFKILTDPALPTLLDSLLITRIPFANL